MRLLAEDVDLAELTARLRLRFRGESPGGYLDGRTALRDAVCAELTCSELEAEDVVETMVVRGFVHYEGDPRAALPEEARWRLG
jgi:hypothetical protein